MLDTGASANCVDKSLVLELGLGDRIDRTKIRRLHDAQKRPLTVLGEILY